MIGISFIRGSDGIPISSPSPTPLAHPAARFQDTQQERKIIMYMSRTQQASTSVLSNTPLPREGHPHEIQDPAHPDTVRVRGESTQSFVPYPFIQPSSASPLGSRTMPPRAL